MIYYKKAKRKEEREFQKYLMNFSRMTKETYEEYKNFMEVNISQRSTEDILKESMEIQQRIASQKQKVVK